MSVEGNVNRVTEYTKKNRFVEYGVAKTDFMPKTVPTIRGHSNLITGLTPSSCIFWGKWCLLFHEHLCQRRRYEKSQIG